MIQANSTSITRRGVVAGLALTAVPLALAGADNARDKFGRLGARDGTDLGNVCR
jgi:hypothetical protein